MKFHGISMVGPFNNQKLAVLPTFSPTRDQSRLVWLQDGTLWYGSDVEWVNMGGSGDANEVEDMYSDLLRTTIFLNASYDEFANEDLISTTTMTHDQKEKRYDFAAGQTLESVDLFDSYTGLAFVDYVMVYVDYIDSGTPTIEVSTDGGSNWYEMENLKVFQIPVVNAGTDVKIKFTGGGTGEVNSWGILYYKDITASCTKYGLTQTNTEALSGQTDFELIYEPGAVQVFLNGFLLDAADYDTTVSGILTLLVPANEGDLVSIVSFSTSVSNEEDYIRKDGSIAFIGPQSMGNNKLTSVTDGTSSDDAAAFGQIATAIGPQSMGNNKLTSVTDGTSSDDAAAFGQIATAIGNISIDNLTDVDTTSSAPSASDFLTWDGNNWVPTTASSGASGTFTTNDGKTVTVVDGLITAIV